MGGVGIWWIVDIVLLITGSLTPEDGSNWNPYVWKLLCDDFVVIEEIGNLLYEKQFVLTVLLVKYLDFVWMKMN